MAGTAPVYVAAIAGLATVLVGYLTFLGKRADDRSRAPVEGFDRLVGRLEVEGQAKDRLISELRSRVDTLEARLEEALLKVERLTEELDQAKLRRHP